jgi:hypothetical protein
MLYFNFIKAHMKPQFFNINPLTWIFLQAAIKHFLSSFSQLRLFRIVNSLIYNFSSGFIQCRGIKWVSTIYHLIHYAPESPDIHRLCHWSLSYKKFRSHVQSCPQRSFEFACLVSKSKITYFVNVLTNEYIFRFHISMAYSHIRKCTQS